MSSYFKFCTKTIQNRNHRPLHVTTGFVVWTLNGENGRQEIQWLETCCAWFWKVTRLGDRNQPEQLAWLPERNLSGFQGRTDRIKDTRRTWISRVSLFNLRCRLLKELSVYTNEIQDCIIRSTIERRLNNFFFVHYITLYEYIILSYLLICI